ncbi:hypothetical protein ERD78_18630 [Allopusillimonas soli]|uniref:Uncharacterized protein n=1 Tax=Allopusillimonas soli TaxID=659016 RepID=A0A853FGS6_9BURK|nr:hypothetical protein [Allopusillimonas soli]NYT38918.1 hypothetical protein [Allopusillimonas soli]TEA70085.1 hypothetical protein ERD78_18630 [Allopusillimonas soli]
MNTHNIMRLMPEVLAALKATGQNVSLAKDLEAAIEHDRKGRSEPVAWPRNAKEIRDFIDTHFISMTGGDEASDDDKYLLTAHDLLSAFDWWTDFAPQPAEPVAWLRSDQLRKLGHPGSDSPLNERTDSMMLHAKGTPEAAAKYGFDVPVYRTPVDAQPTEPVTNAHTDDDAVDHFAAAMKEKLAQARAKGRHGWHECDPKDLSTMLRAHVEKGDPRDVANFCMFLWSLGQPISAAPQPAKPFLWYRPRPGAEAHADGRCYDIVFSDPHDTRFFPLYRNAPQPAEPEDEKLNLDRLADYISDNWPDKKYSLEEIAQRLHATWPGAFMPAEPVKVESDAEPVCWWVTWDADNVGVAPIRAGLYMFETHEAAEKYVSKVMSLAKLDAKRPAIVPLYAAPVTAQPSAPDEARREALLDVIRRLNSNPYSLTKSECILEVEAMLARYQPTKDPS